MLDFIGREPGCFWIPFNCEHSDNFSQLSTENRPLAYYLGFSAYSKDLEEELRERGFVIPRKDDGQFKFSDVKSLLKANEASVAGINIADCKSFKPKSKNTFRLLLNPVIE